MRGSVGLIVLAGLCLCLMSTSAKSAGPETLPTGAIWAKDADQWVVEPFVGNNSAGEFIQGPALESGFGTYGDRVQGMVFDGEGNAIIAGDACVARLDKEGRVRFLAGVPGVMGFRDGPAARALFSGIRAIVLGPDGQIYILDRGNRCIRQLVSRRGEYFVKTIAGSPDRTARKDGPVAEAGFHDPCNLAADSKGRLYTFDENHIRRIAQGQVKTIPVKATFNLIMGAGCCFDDKDNLYVADRWNWAVRKVDLKTGRVIDVIGKAGRKHQPGEPRTRDGIASEALIHDSPGYVVFDPVRGYLYTNGVDEGLIRRYKDGWIETLAGGSGGRWWFGPAKGALMRHAGIATVDKEGNLYEIEGMFTGVRRIRYVGKQLSPKPGSERESSK